MPSSDDEDGRELKEVQMIEMIAAQNKKESGLTDALEDDHIGPRSTNLRRYEINVSEVDASVVSY